MNLSKFTSLRGTAGTPEVYSSGGLNPHWFLQPEVGRLIFLALEPWAGGFGVGLGLITPEISRPNFYPPHMDVGPACLTSSHSHQSGWMWFNSLVVRLPFNLTSDSSECWLWYSLVVTLTWLCKKVSCVYLCCHLDQKSSCPGCSTEI